MRHLLIVAMVLALAACAPAARQPYREPAGGATVEVTFRNATPGRTEVALFEDAAECTGRRYLPDLLIGERRTVRVPAGEPLAFGVRYGVPNTTPPRYCEVLASFQTAPGGSYEVAIEPSGERLCTARVAQLAGPPAVQGLQVLLRAPVKAHGEQGPFCYPIR